MNVLVITSGAYTKPEVIAEVVYVLKSVYSIPKEKIKSIIRGLSAGCLPLVDRRNDIHF